MSPMSEGFLALVILLEPIAYVVRWVWRGLSPSRLLKNPTLGIGPACEFDYDAHDDSHGGAHAR